MYIQVGKYSGEFQVFALVRSQLPAMYGSSQIADLVVSHQLM